jgi:pantetheine-phosphate adenylyltransferase
MPKAIIYPGTFDPITNGHVDLISRAAKLFEKVIVAVAAHSSKKTLLSFEERVSLSSESLKSFKNVKVLGFQGLLVEFARKQKINLILRGIRVIADFEFEKQLLGMNQQLAPELETIFMTPTEKYAHISSTFVRDIAKLKGDISSFVPKNIVKRLEKHGFDNY